MPYRIAGIDVHKGMLAGVVSAVEIDGEYNFERRQLGRNPTQRRWLAEWRIEPQVEEVVMESTAQYWKPVWGALEGYGKPMPEGGRGPSHIGNTAPGAGTIEPRTAGAQERLCRRRTSGEAAGS